MINKLDNDGLIQWLNTQHSGLDENKKPSVILSYASSLDGSIAKKRGLSTTISCDQSAIAVHHIRSFCDAILVGIGTVLSDNPQLSVRLVPGDNPLPVIIDSDLRTPLDSNLICNNRNPIIFCGLKADKNRKKTLESRGAVVLVAPEIERGLSIISIIQQLYDRGIKHLMVEGGAEILKSFLVEDLWDKLAVTVAPSLLGGYNILENISLKSEIKFENVKWLSAGIDQICLINREEL